MNQLTLSIVLTVRDQASVLPTLVQECLAVVPRYFSDYELIIVDDGSRDATPMVATELAARHKPVMLIRHQRARSYASALIDGLSAARGDLLLSMGTGLPPAIGALPRLLGYLENADLVTGYRIQPEAGLRQRLAGLVFTQLSGRLLNFQLYDSVAHITLLRAEWFHQIGAEVSGPLADLELQIRVVRAGARRVQVELDAETAAVRPGLAATRELLQLRRRLRRPMIPDTTPRNPAFWRQRPALSVALAAAVGGAWIFWRQR